MVQYHADNGTCKVPDHSELAEWCYRQRCAYEGKTLSKTRQEKLLTLGFVWDHQPGDHERYRKLTAPPPTPRNKTKVEDGDIVAASVPAGKSKSSCNGFKSEAAPTSERGKKKQFEECLEQLKAFYSENGHGRIPLPYKANPKLAKWADNMRKLERQGKMDLEQFDLLDAFGFNWMVQPEDTDLDMGVLSPSGTNSEPRMTESERFDHYYSKAAAFKEEHGHAFVPSKYP